MSSTSTQAERKRNLSSPFDLTDHKTTKPDSSYTYTMSSIDEQSGDITDASQDCCTTGKFSLCSNDLEHISEILEKSFQQSFESRISVLVAIVVDQVTTKMSEKISALEEENNSLKIRVTNLEHQADVSEQYSRRNSLRLSGVAEDKMEDTDKKVVEVAKDLGIDISIDEIDRSHRVGKPKTFAATTAGRHAARPRDIIINFTSYRSRQKLLTRKSRLRGTGHTDVYINEDLTRTRSNILFEARRLLKAKHVSSVRTHDGIIMVKDHNMKTSRVETMTDLNTMKAALGLNQYFEQYTTSIAVIYVTCTVYQDCSRD